MELKVERFSDKTGQICRLPDGKQLFVLSLPIIFAHPVSGSFHNLRMVHFFDCAGSGVRSFRGFLLFS
jgi:hypothetical protein